jgi:hypothetical protein
MEKIPSAIRFFCIVMLCCLSSSSFAIMKGLSTEELTKASDLVIVGEVINVEAQWSKDEKTIFTSVYIVINNIIKGAPKQAMITVEYEGGEIGDIGLQVSDQSSLMKGEKIILFLKSGKSKKDGFVYNIVGKNQGKYLIGEDGVARKGGFSVIGQKDNIDNNISVDELIEKIKKAEQ